MADTENSSGRPGPPPRMAEVDCTIMKVLGTDSAGARVMGEQVEEKCCVLDYDKYDAELLAGFGSCPEFSISPLQPPDVVIVLRVTTRAAAGDLLELAGRRCKVIAIASVYDSVGKLAHQVAQAVNLP